MTNDKWQEIVEYVLKRLKTDAEFDFDRAAFFTKFDLVEEDCSGFMTKRDYPRLKYFEVRTVEHASRLVLVFSRLEPPA